MNMTRKERYRIDPEYRSKVNADNRARYYRNIAENPQFLKIHLLKSRIKNARVSIQYHQGKLEFFLDRIERDLRLLRRLVTDSGFAQQRITPSVLGSENKDFPDARSRP